MIYLSTAYVITGNSKFYLSHFDDQAISAFSMYVLPLEPRSGNRGIIHLSDPLYQQIIT